ncbi:MAG: hypothetical protein AAGD13_01055 [Pseudomonadota bacterium]
MLNELIPLSGTSVSEIQNRLASTQALRAQAQHHRTNALLAASESPLKLQARKNDLRRDKRITEQEERAIVAPLLEDVAKSPDPARAYAEAVRRAQAAGVDIQPEYEVYDPDSFAILRSMYSMSAPEATDFQRTLAGLGSDDERLRAVRIRAGIEPDANTALAAEQRGGFTLGPGQTRFDQSGAAVAATPSVPAKAPAGYRLSADGQSYEIIPGGPADPSVMETHARARGPATQITIGNGQQLPQPPAGTVWQMGPDGKPMLDDRGAPTAIPFAGGPVMADQAAASEQAQGRREQALREATVVTEDISRAIGIIQSSNWPTTGLFGAALANLPGSSAHDLNKMMDTIRSNSAFGALQKMRENSPTGGALGAVSERELSLLQSTIGSLEQSQGQQQVLDNLSRVHNTFLDVIFGAGEGPQRLPVSFRQGDVQRRLEFLEAQYPSDPARVMRIMESEGLLQ